MPVFARQCLESEPAALDPFGDQREGAAGAFGQAVQCGNLAGGAGRDDPVRPGRRDLADAAPQQQVDGPGIVARGGEAVGVFEQGEGLVAVRRPGGFGLGREMSNA